MGTVHGLEVYLEHDLSEDRWPCAAEDWPVRCLLICEEALFVQETVGDGVVVLRRASGTYGPAMFRLHAVGAGRSGLRLLLVDRGGRTIGAPSAATVEILPAC
jgi:hypothetical protein